MEKEIRTMKTNNDRISMATLEQTVKLIDGFTERYGKVFGVIRSDFGDMLRIKLDDYTFTTVSYFVSVGIGAYLMDA